MPIMPDSVTLVGGFGVIEHLKDARPALRNIFRSLRKGGVSFNTVPYLNIGNVLYRSVLWGSIPNMPVLKQIVEFINIKLLKGKRMAFGYELQLSAGQLRAMHLASGFRKENVSVKQFEVNVKMEFIKTKWLKSFCRYLSENCRQFWPMVKVVAVKI
jgi:predicted SAM-dependent methyltransferase